MSSKKKSTLPDHPLKVLMLAPTPYFSDRGCHVRIYEEAKALRSLGVDVRIVTYHLGRDLSPIPTYRTCKIPWYNKREAGPSWHKPYLDILLLCRAAQVAKSFKPDIIHAHLHEGALIGFFLKKWLKVPLLFDYQGSLTAEVSAHGFVNSTSFLHRLFRIFEKEINMVADRTITSSTASALTLVNEWSMPTERVATVIDGVDTDFFVPIDKMTCREKIGVSRDVPVVGFLGLLNEYQGLDILLQAIFILKSRREKVHFLIMGFPEKEYREKSQQMDVTDMITFTGRVAYESAPVYLSACDFAVSPKISLSEANGKLFNYMACGLPTIVFETPINREILGETGIYADYGNAEDLAAKIILLRHCGNEQLQRLARHTREKAEREHGWQARGHLLLQHYHQVLNR